MVFLPEGVISPEEYYILKQNRETHVERKALSMSGTLIMDMSN